MQLKLLSIKLASIFTDVVILSAYHTCIKFVCCWQHKAKYQINELGSCWQHKAKYQINELGSCWQHKAKYQINELGSWILIIPSLGGVLSDICICLFSVVFVQFVRQE